MPTRNISLTKRLDDFVDATVRQGSHQNASEVIRDGLRLLEAKHKEDATKLERLRAAVHEGFEAHERGDYIEVKSRADLKRFMKTVGRPAAPKGTKRSK